MTDCRDWSATMRRGSYKGVRFWVDADSQKGGRRIAIHEFTMRDTPFNEDLGGKANQFTVDAYLGGDTADIEASALFGICNTRGAGPLILPLGGSISAQCIDVQLKHDYRKLGVIKVSMVFVQDFGLAGGLVAFAHPVLTAQIAVTAAFDVVASAFASRYDGLSSTASNIANMTDIAQSAAVNEIRYINAVFISTLAGVQSEPAAHADAHLASQLIENQATGLARQGQVYSSFKPTEFAARNDIDAAAIQGPQAGYQLVELAGKLLVSTDDNIALFRALIVAVEAISLPSLLDADLEHLSVSRRGRAILLKNIRIMARQVLALAAMQAAAAAAEQINSYRIAKLVRAELVEFTGPVLGEAATSEEMSVLSNARGKAVDAITKAIEMQDPNYGRNSGSGQNTPLSSDIVVEAPKSMSAVYWAWRLYGDPQRAEELISINEVPHPLFMPTRFEALSA